MNTKKLLMGAESADRRIGLNKLTARGAVPLVSAILLASGCCSSQAAADATYKLLGREVGGYTSKDDLAGIVKKELGTRGSIADWREIKSQFGDSESAIKGFCDKAGLSPNGSAWVTQSGQPLWQSGRHYFVQRADHKLPEDFMLHDQVQSNFLLLGSWTDARPILVRIIGYSEADAAKWTKWDKMFAALNEVDVSGVYRLVSVDGKKLPASVSHDGAVLEMRSGTFTITAEGKCLSKMTFVPPASAEATVQVTATYTREGPKLNLQWEHAGRTTGVISGTRFTMENVGMVLVYEK